jgi:hypothetical protein
LRTDKEQSRDDRIQINRIMRLDLVPGFSRKPLHFNSRQYLGRKLAKIYPQHAIAKYEAALLKGQLHLKK